MCIERVKCRGACLINPMGLLGRLANRVKMNERGGRQGKTGNGWRAWSKEGAVEKEGNPTERVGRRREKPTRTARKRGSARKD